VYKNLYQLFANCLRARTFEVYGEPCDDFEPGCACCEAWRFVDLILDETEIKLERKKPCE
jgi:hypothetical protein